MEREEIEKALLEIKERIAKIRQESITSAPKNKKTTFVAISDLEFLLKWMERSVERAQRRKVEFDE